MICPECKEDLCKVEFLYFDHDEKFDYHKPKEICYDCSQSKLERLMVYIPDSFKTVGIMETLRDYSESRGLSTPHLITELSAALTIILIHTEMDDEDFRSFSNAMYEGLVIGKAILKSNLNEGK